MIITARYIAKVRRDIPVKKEEYRHRAGNARVRGRYIKWGGNEALREKEANESERLREPEREREAALGQSPCPVVPSSMRRSSRDVTSVSWLTWKRAYWAIRVKSN